MADEQISLSLVHVVLGFLGTVFASIISSVKAALVWFARRERAMKDKIDDLQRQVATNNIAVAVLKSQGERIERVLEKIDQKQDRQMELLLKSTDTRRGQ